MAKTEWTKEQKQAASERMKARHASNKQSKLSSSMRVPVGGRRNVTAVNDTPEGYVDRWVNDTPGRVDRFKRAGYETVSAASVGDSGIDGSHNESGVVSRDMGKGVTAYLMRQREDYFTADQKEKQLTVDASEESIRRDVKDKLNDGHYGSVTINRHQS